MLNLCLPIYNDCVDNYCDDDYNNYYDENDDENDDEGDDDDDDTNSTELQYNIFISITANTKLEILNTAFSYSTLIVIIKMITMIIMIMMTMMMSTLKIQNMTPIVIIPSRLYIN